MKTIAQLPTIEEAHLLRTILAEEGIEAVVLDEGMGGHFLGPGSVFAEFRVQVAEEDEDLARPHVEQFTARAVPAVPDSAAPVKGTPVPQRGVSVKLFQILSVGAFMLHFANREVLQSQDLSVLPELRRSLDAMAANPSVVALLEHFGLVWEVVYSVALLGFAALWRRARFCFLFTWLWSAVFTAFAGPGTSHGIPGVLFWIENCMGMFLLGVSCCTPVAEHFGSRRKR